MDYKFKIGDRVKIIDGSGIEGYTGGWVETMYGLCGEIATISARNTSLKGRPYYNLKSENGDIKSWFMFDERGLKKANEERKIIITTDGTMTRAALYDDHKLIKEALATCSKADAFDFEKGAEIAFERLTAKPAVKAKPKKELKPLNTKIFVLNGDDILKSSHIYEVKDGKIRAFIGSYPTEGLLYNMNDVVNYLKPQLLRSGDENYDSNGVKFSVYDNMKQITVMEVKEG